MPRSILGRVHKTFGASQVALAVMNPPVNAGEARDTGSIPGSGRSLGRDDLLEMEMATHSSILARKSLWTEEPGGQ